MSGIDVRGYTTGMIPCAVFLFTPEEDYAKLQQPLPIKGEEDASSFLSSFLPRTVKLTKIAREMDMQYSHNHIILKADQLRLDQSIRRQGEKRNAPARTVVRFDQPSVRSLLLRVCG